MFYNTFTQQSKSTALYSNILLKKDRIHQDSTKMIVSHTKYLNRGHHRSWDFSITSSHFFTYRKLIYLWTEVPNGKILPYQARSIFSSVKSVRFPNKWKCVSTILNIKMYTKHSVVQSHRYRCNQDNTPSVLPRSVTKQKNNSGVNTHNSSPRPYVLLIWRLTTTMKSSKSSSEN